MNLSRPSDHPKEQNKAEQNTAKKEKKRKAKKRKKPYHTTRRLQLIRLTIKLIPIPLDIIHPVQNHDTVLPQRAPGPGVRYPARLLFRSRIVVDSPRMRGVVGRDDVDFIAGFEGRGGVGEELVLGLVEGGLELVRSVG